METGAKSAATAVDGRDAEYRAFVRDLMGVIYTQWFRGAGGQTFRSHTANPSDNARHCGIFPHSIEEWIPLSHRQVEWGGFIEYVFIQ